MPNYHPLIVHFPIALLTCLLIIEVLGAVLRKHHLSMIGWWLQCMGTIGLALALLSGLQAKSGLDLGANALEYFEMHEQLAFVSGILFFALLFWRIGTRGDVPLHGKVWFFGLLAVAVGTMWTGAWYGGILVYYFGVGVSK